MKKLLGIMLIVVLLAGCSFTNKYKEGVYEGSAIDNYGGEENTATAKVTIDKDGKITDIYLDTTYTTKDGQATTKKTLGPAYGMKKGNSAYGQADLEWYEQIEKLEQAIIEKQEITFLTVDEDGYIDTVSGCTIKVDALYKALENALNKAK